MCSHTDRIALIPAYQPDEKLPALAREAESKGFSVIVVDDGSGPAYTELFEETQLYATVLTHPFNQGKGCALKTGFSYIRDYHSSTCTIVTLDADGQHTIADALRISEQAYRYPDYLILGRRVHKEKIPLRSKVGNDITRIVYSLAAGIKVEDTQTGLRGFSGKLLEQMLSIEGSRYEYEMNVLLTCPKLGIPIMEIPVTSIYLNDNQSSHFKPCRDSFLIYKEILKFSASSLTGFLVDYGLFNILCILTAGLGTAASLVASNIIARIVSASVNYQLNRKFVFKQQEHAVRSALQYAILAAVILFGNTLFLSFLTETLSINHMIAKLLTEICFFILSWLVQKKLIFRNHNKKEVQPCF